jgi:hypothetical protein
MKRLPKLKNTLPPMNAEAVLVWLAVRHSGIMARNRLLLPRCSQSPVLKIAGLAHELYLRAVQFEA